MATNNFWEQNEKSDYEQAGPKKLKFKCYWAVIFLPSLRFLVPKNEVFWFNFFNMEKIRNNSWGKVMKRSICSTYFPIIRRSLREPFWNVLLLNTNVTLVSTNAFWDDIHFIIVSFNFRSMKIVDSRTFQQVIV